MLVEVIGLPGSGKSTLVRKLFARKDIKTHFYTWQNTKVGALKYFVKNNRGFLPKRVYGYIQGACAIPALNKVFADYFFMRVLKYSGFLYEDQWGSIAQTAIQEVLKRDSHFALHPLRINWELEKVMRARLMAEYAQGKKKNLILDEGILTVINTFAAAEEQVMALDLLLLPNTIIFVHTDIETVMGVSEIRTSGNRIPSMRNRSYDEREQLFTRKQDKYVQMCRILGERGIPVICYERDGCIDTLVKELKERL